MKEQLSLRGGWRPRPAEGNARENGPFRPSSPLRHFTVATALCPRTHWRGVFHSASVLRFECAIEKRQPTTGDPVTRQPWKHEQKMADESMNYFLTDSAAEMIGSIE